MRIFPTIVFSLFALSGLMAQNLEKIEYDFKAYDRLRISDDFEVTYVQTEGERYARLEADQRLVPYLDVYQDGRTLYVGLKNGAYGWGIRRQPTLRLSLGNSGTLTDVGLRSDAILLLETPLTVDRLDIELASDAQLCGTIRAETLYLKAASDANAKLSGRIGKMDARLASDAYLKAFELEVGDLDIRLSSDAWAEITVADKLRAVANSDAVLRYRGDPRNVNQKTSSDGRIVRKGL